MLQTKTMIFKNQRTLFLWGIATLFLLIAVAMSYILVRNGGPASNSPPPLAGIVAAFWVATLGISTFAAYKPCITVSVVPEGRIFIRWRYPFGTRAREVGCGDVSPAIVFGSWAGDGDPYYHARITLADGTIVDLSEGQDPAFCSAVCTRFNAAVLGHPPMADQKSP